MSLKQKLLQNVWNKKEYAKASQNKILTTFYNNFALVKLKKYSLKANNILDCGCGDGRIIGILWRKDAFYTGIDISKRAILKAKSKFKFKKNTEFLVGDIERITLPSNSFDLVYCVYTFEHLDKPQKVILEMVRVVKKDGLVIIVCPNFGSPFQPSGLKLLSGDTGFKRALKLFIKSHKYLISYPNSLNWNKVYPKALEKGRWEPDWDTTNEPYVQTLIYFLKKLGLETVESSSGIEYSKYRSGKSLLGKLRFVSEVLGKKGIAPYKYYGPTLFVVAKK